MKLLILLLLTSQTVDSTGRCLQWDPHWNLLGILPSLFVHCPCDPSSTPEIPVTDPPTTITTTTTEPPSPEQVIENAEEEIEEILQEIALDPKLTPEEIVENLDNLTEIIDNIVNNEQVLENITSAQVESIANSTITIVDSVFENGQSWQVMAEEERKQASDRIFSLVDSISFMLNTKWNDSVTVVNFTKENLVLVAKKWDREDCDQIHYDFGASHIQLPFEAISDFARHDEPLLATATWMKAQILRLRIGELILDSPAISLLLGTSNHSIQLKEPFVKYGVPHRKLLSFKERSQCGFWSETFNLTGCWVVEWNRSYTICQCNHLTDFLRLIDVGGTEMEDEEKDLLTRITSGITIASLLVAFALSYINKENYVTLNAQFRLKTNYSLITLNIYVCLLISHIIILAFMDRTENESEFQCQAISFTLQFTLLSTFTFICLRCYNLFKQTTEAFKDDQPLRLYLSLGYGIPFLIIGLALAYLWIVDGPSLMFCPFTSDYFCWLSGNNTGSLPTTHIRTHIVYLFVSPMILFVGLDLLFLALIINSMLRNKLRIQSRFENYLVRVSTRFISITILVINFGICWLFFFLYTEEILPQFAYAFIVLNGTQGFFLLIEQMMYYFTRKRKRQLTTVSSGTLSTHLSSSLSNKSYS